MASSVQPRRQEGKDDLSSDKFHGTSTRLQQRKPKYCSYAIHQWPYNYKWIKELS